MPAFTGIKEEIVMEVNVVTTTSRYISCGPCDLLSLLEHGYSDGAARYIIQTDSGALSMLLLQPAPSCLSLDASWDLQAAVRFLEASLSQSRVKTTCFVATSSNVSSAELKRPLLISVLPLNHASADSILLSPADRETILLATQKHRSKLSSLATIWSASLNIKRVPYLQLGLKWVAAALFLGLLLFIANATLASHPAIWKRYNTVGSIGPQYQLQFAHDNVSEWSQTHSHKPDEWFLRIDDQAMIPKALVDEEELQYQDWYQRRYPEMNQIRLDELYLSEKFLSDPHAIQVPADRAFHMSHCVRAIRRYWQAKETGRHICPRDIDYKHMKHCLDALDEWAFPAGPRGSVGGMIHQGHHKRDAEEWDIDPTDHTFLIWKTKVCFN